MAEFTNEQNRAARRLSRHLAYRKTANSVWISRTALWLISDLNWDHSRFKKLLMYHVRAQNSNPAVAQVVGAGMFKKINAKFGIAALQKDIAKLKKDITRNYMNKRFYQRYDQVTAPAFVREFLEETDLRQMLNEEYENSYDVSSSSGLDDDGGDNDEGDDDEGDDVQVYDIDLVGDVDDPNNDDDIFDDEVVIESKKTSRPPIDHLQMSDVDEALSTQNPQKKLRTEKSV